MSEQFAVVQECGGSFRFFGTKDECIALVVQAWKKYPDLDYMVCYVEDGKVGRAVTWVAKDWHMRLPVKDRDGLCRLLRNNGYTEVRAVIVGQKYLFLGTKDGMQTGFTYDQRKKCLVSKN